MVLLRHLLGDVLRRLRMRQGRTLREVSASARVSLGYLSEVERGQKEASSELLAAICAALDTPLSQVFREVSDNFALAELQNEPVIAAPREPSLREPGLRVPSGGTDGATLDRAALQRAALRNGLDRTGLGRDGRRALDAPPASAATATAERDDFDEPDDFGESGNDFGTGHIRDISDMVPV
jgi:transcriptional regulator with XRE-family HTH domain